MTGKVSFQNNEASAPSSRWLLFSRMVMLFIGAVLILSGGIKALDLNLFVRQIQSYGFIIHPQLTALIAWAITTVECILGSALLINYRPRQMLNITFVMFVGFTLLTLYAAIRGGVEDCGCFGALVKRTPMQAAVEDGVMLFLIIVARRGCHKSQKRTSRLQPMAVLAATLTGAALPLFTGVPTALVGQQQSVANGVWPSLQVEGIAGIDFNRGVHLVVLMSASCQHCQEAVPELSMLMEDLASQPLSVIGLGQDSAEALQGFIDEWMPAYPIGRINPDAFWSLLGDANLPRIILVKDGRSARVWDGRVPDTEEIRQLLP